VINSASAWSLIWITLVSGAPTRTIAVVTIPKYATTLTTR